MIDTRPDKDPPGILARFRRLPRSKKVILIVFLIWFAQAAPKWIAAITADRSMGSDSIDNKIKGVGDKRFLFSS